MLLQFNFNRPQCHVITYCWYRSLILTMKSSIFFLLLASWRSFYFALHFFLVNFFFVLCSVTHIQDEKWFYHLLRSTYSSYVRWVIILIIANILWLPIYQLLARKIHFLIVISFFCFFFYRWFRCFYLNSITFFVGMLPHEK